jgi:class 3 adenylate cyclase
VYVAARLEALAEPGGICVSRVVRAEVAVPRQMFHEILMLIAQLRAPPAPA